MFERLNKKDGVGSVVPAKAGIQFNPSGFRLRAGMTMFVVLSITFIFPFNSQ
jgi:hypothetical protein